MAPIWPLRAEAAGPNLIVSAIPASSGICGLRRPLQECLATSEMLEPLWSPVPSAGVSGDLQNAGGLAAEHGQPAQPAGRAACLTQSAVCLSHFQLQER